jgi:S1-C subfamily serine protease
MISTGKAKTAGVVLGIALFVAAGLNVMVAAGDKPKAASLQPGPIESAVVAPAAQNMATSPQTGSSLVSKLGLAVQTLTPDLAKQLGVNVKKGVVITAVNVSSLASLAGLQKGDVIVEADHQHITNVDDLEQVLSKAQNKNQVLLRVARSGVSLFVVLRMK